MLGVFQVDQRKVTLDFIPDPGGRPQGPETRLTGSVPGEPSRPDGGRRLGTGEPSGPCRPAGRVDRGKEGSGKTGPALTP